MITPIDFFYAMGVGLMFGGFASILWRALRS